MCDELRPSESEIGEQGDGPMMDCNRFQEALADLDRPGVLSADLCEEALAHAEGCGDCGQLLTETELLDSELRQFAARGGDGQAPARVEAKLLNALRRRNSVAERKTAWRYAAAVGIAAVLLLAIGLWLNRPTAKDKRLPGLKVSEPLVAVKSATQGSNWTSSATRNMSVARTDTREMPASHSVLKSTKRDAADADALVADTDGTSGFIALPDADPGPVDDGAVVRVEMPRAALASFGLPVEAMEGSGTVRADLIVNADGTPQAIRLLSRSDAAAAQQ
jgi:hypothetical protein